MSLTAACPRGPASRCLRAPELSCPLKWRAGLFICLHFHLRTAQPLIRSIFLFLLLLNESLGAEERPEVWAPKGHNFLSTMVVWPSYLKQTCPRESALLGLPLIKFAYRDNVNLKGEVGVGRGARSRRKMSTAHAPNIWSCFIWGTSPPSHWAASGPLGFWKHIKFYLLVEYLFSDELLGLFRLVSNSIFSWNLVKIQQVLLGWI